MKVFQCDTGSWKEKVNFVDDNNVLVGYDMEQNCCENAGWFISSSEPTGITSESNNPEGIRLDGYQFDVDFIKTIEGGESFDIEALAIFRLTKGDDEIFLAIYNEHNGYYSHGFTVKVGGKIIMDDEL